MGAVSAVIGPLSVCLCVETIHTCAFDVEIYDKLKYKDEHGPDVDESSALVTPWPFCFLHSRLPCASLAASLCTGARSLSPGKAYQAHGLQIVLKTLRESS